jgi:hypothetical protein
MSYEDFSFSPKNIHVQYRSLADLRPPDELIDSNTQHNILDHLILKQERHEALRNYYFTIIAQVKDFTKNSISFLDDQRKALVEEIESKYKDSVKDVKKKAFKKEQELNLKLNEANLHYDQATLIIEKLRMGLNDKNLIKQAEDCLKTWASEVESTKSTWMFPVPSLNLPFTEYTEYTSIGRNLQISTLLSDLSPISSKSKLKLFVPFGVPSYTYFYLLNLTSSIPCSMLIQFLLSYLNIDSLNLSYKNSLIPIPITEKISAETKELYVVID